MMIFSKELVKIHGSSIMGLLNKRPKYVCCQNLVVSGVTGRTMAKCLIPISETVFNMQEASELRHIEKKLKDTTTEKEIKLEQPTAILRYLRSKNHNEYIQKKLREHKAYLETDEEHEKILYFYLHDNRKDKDKRQKIYEMINKIDKDCRRNIFKRNFTAPISDKCKLHVNEFGKVVDLLDAREYISFLIKSANVEIYEHLLSACKKLGLGNEDIHIMPKKMANIMLVYLKDKHIAKHLFKKCRKHITEKKGINSRSPSLSVPYLRHEEKQLWRQVPEVEGRTGVVRRTKRSSRKASLRRRRICAEGLQGAESKP
jgi:hypothetical protein